MSPLVSVTPLQVENYVFPPTVNPTGSTSTLFLAGAGHRGLEIEGKFVKFTAIGVYLEESAIPFLADKWKGKTVEELKQSVEFFRDVVTGPFEKFTRVTMILPLTGKQYSEKVAENCVAHWKAIGTYTDAESKAIEKFIDVFKSATFPPAASILFTQSPIGSLTISFSKDDSVTGSGNAVIENKQLSEAVLESIIGKHGVSPAAKCSLAERVSELLNKSYDEASVCEKPGIEKSPDPVAGLQLGQEKNTTSEIEGKVTIPEIKDLIPLVAGKPLDLHRLFIEVTSRGGIEKVIRERKWGEVVRIFSFPSSVTSASFVLRKYYLSMLYHFEQVYYFRKEEPSVSVADPTSRNLDDCAVDQANDDSAATNHCSLSYNLEAGSSLLGIIDAKFDYGYVITVNLGSENLNGVLYHTPGTVALPHPSQRVSTSAGPSQRIRKRRRRLASKDPSRPKSNRSGYNFFFAEHYARLKPSYQGQERAISKRIGLLWSRLTEAEKQVYQEKGVRDKERYKAELQEYKSSHPQPQ